MKFRIFGVIAFVLLMSFWVLPWHVWGQTTHSVTISWTPPGIVGGSGSVKGYNVYRGTVTGGPYTKQNATPAPASPYVDTAIVSGTKYFYVVTTVDTANNESAFSNETSATAIGNPNPPMGAAATAQ